MLPTAVLDQVATEHPYPLLFATISGAHLYGFASPDSDFDLRGVHVLPVREIAGLRPTRDTIEQTGDREGMEIDLVTHDAKKFFGLMLRKNGYVLEQLHSPLVVKSSPAHDELKEIAKGCVTRHHSHHYLGFAETQWNLFQKEDPRRVKPLLYVYRVLLTGIHLMRTGKVQANIVELNRSFRLTQIEDLVDVKVNGTEQQRHGPSDLGFHEQEYLRLRGTLAEASAQSSLPETPTAAARLHDLLVRIRTTPH